LAACQPSVRRCGSAVCQSSRQPRDLLPRVALTWSSQQRGQRIFAPHYVGAPPHRSALASAGIAPFNRPPICTYGPVIAAVLPALMAPDHRHRSVSLPKLHCRLHTFAIWMKPVAVPKTPACPRCPNAPPARDLLNVPSIASDVAEGSARPSTDSLVEAWENIASCHNPVATGLGRRR
jgi:hypothetical protein